MHKKQDIKNANKKQTNQSSVGDPDPGSGAFLTSGSWMGKNQDPDFREHRTNFWLKILKFFDADPDPRIFLTLDPGRKNQGSGINIPDPQY
jgi:hypothetical protein